ncbi:hypothetical protein SISNIDRAFT_498879 [Sistotremastrum niveocremeum HHB9708]|uniref:Uncharacterized protein n=1 Tax=Sistotremastrum niveocremeum HHB9708 TaxID=1314777 RepID=A0A165AB95_9AGAM|nr:hypothetical protein SISNIDRAFT_498879 [Sistotremastrum niveocremeum HHB9708]
MPLVTAENLRNFSTSEGRQVAEVDANPFPGTPEMNNETRAKLNVAELKLNHRLDLAGWARKGVTATETETEFSCRRRVAYSFRLQLQPQPCQKASVGRTQWLQCNPQHEVRRPLLCHACLQCRKSDQPLELGLRCRRRKVTVGVSYVKLKAPVATDHRLTEESDWPSSPSEHEAWNTDTEALSSTYSESRAR